MTLETTHFVRKPFHVEGVQVTAENIHDVAAWCGGNVQVQFVDEVERFFVKVDVRNPLRERQTQGFVGDWVLKAGTGFRVYTNSAMVSTFDREVSDVRVVDIALVTGRPLTAVGQALIEAQNQVAVAAVEEVFAEAHESATFTD